jgi:hypothetical protein
MSLCKNHTQSFHPNHIGNFIIRLYLLMTLCVNYRGHCAEQSDSNKLGESAHISTQIDPRQSLANIHSLIHFNFESTLEPSASPTDPQYAKAQLSRYSHNLNKTNLKLWLTHDVQNSVGTHFGSLPMTLIGEFDPAFTSEKTNCLDSSSGNKLFQDPCNQHQLINEFSLWIPFYSQSQTLVSLKAGLMPVPIGGFEIADNKYDRLFMSDYLALLLPFNRYNQSLTLAFSSSNEYAFSEAVDTRLASDEGYQFGLQILEDDFETQHSPGNTIARTTQPTALFFGRQTLTWDEIKLKWVLQTGTYNQNHGIITSFGIKTLVPLNGQVASLAYDSTLDRRLLLVGEERKIGSYFSQVITSWIPIDQQKAFEIKGSSSHLFSCRCYQNASGHAEAMQSWQINGVYSFSADPKVGPQAKFYLGPSRRFGRESSADESSTKTGLEGLGYHMGVSADL